MKTTAKTAYIFLGAAFMFSSCSQEEVPDKLQEGCDRRIVFHTSLPELTTKAQEIVSDLSRFYLTVYDETDPSLLRVDTLKAYYNRKEIIVNGTPSGFSSDSCIWPEPGKEADLLHFYAYYPKTLPSPSKFVNNTKVGEGGVTVDYRIENFTVAPDIADQVDFMTAYTTGSMANDLFKGISLNFRHHLSRVEVKAKGTHKSCDIEIAGFALGSAPMQATFDFPKSDDAEATWTDVVKGNATYIFSQGDDIVTAGADPVSIMGSKIDDENENSAMVIPSVASAWDYSKDIHNEKEGLYLNVLLRIIDKTPTTGKGKQQYPYYDNSQGLNAMNIAKVYLAVDKATGKKVSRQLYKKDDGYFTDKDFNNAYALPDTEIVKEFGWAAVPVSGSWEPGKIYTYTLDYTYGVGVHGPEVAGETAPRAGDPIISDRVGVSMSVNRWQVYNVKDPVVVPGS